MWINGAYLESLLEGKGEHFNISADKKIENKIGEMSASKKCKPEAY